MSFKLEQLSPNLVLIINTMLQNDNVAKYVHYDVKNPLSQPSLTDNTSLFLDRVFPAPFDLLTLIDDCTQIRVYYLDGLLKKAVEDTRVIFDIVVAKSLWLTNDSTPVIRPYEIMKEIVQTMDNKGIGTIGRLHFTNWRHVVVNEKFDCIRIVADMLAFNEGF